MNFNDILQVVLYIALIVVITPPLGKFMAKVFSGEKNFLTPVLGGPEKLFYRVLRIDPDEGMDWKRYLFAVLWFNFFGFALLMILLLTQKWHPLNPQNLDNVPFWLSFNTAASFMTNTNWQSYAGETTMSYFTQMAGLTVQNFVSAATAIAVLLALIRGLVKKQGKELGNFWQDMVRIVLYVLVPLSVIMTIFLVSQGTVQTFAGFQNVITPEGTRQVIPLGPAASQIAIKQLGTNGGGFFNVNSAFPFENPTPLSNLIEMLAILGIGAGLTYTYGKMAGSLKQGRILFIAMMILFIAGLSLSLYSEYSHNNSSGLTANMEGKETRFGITNSVIWSSATTSASNGSVNSMHDSMTPLTGMVELFNMQIGEIIFGGVGCGLYGMLIYVFITVFIAGLMIGRTPEYLGKKIEALEIKMSILALLIPSAVVLIFSAIASATSTGLSGLTNRGPHGFSEILYTFSSAAGNNGSAFAGINANTNFYNILIGIGVIIGRFGVLVPVMVIAGSLVKKNISPESSGTLKTDNPLFVFFLIAVIIIIGALTFFPALSLGPIAEHILMNNGVSF
jgi:potassium-transporting ATPase potassium-binding subunit